MADNATLNPGSGGITIATDDIGGVHYPVDKIAFGADGSATLVSESNPLPSKEKRSGTATTSSVNDSATSATLLSSNSSRLGATVVNDSASVLYIKCGTTASATDYTVRVPQYGYWECPFGYTGRIDGIWSADSTGAARITEFT